VHTKQNATASGALTANLASLPRLANAHSERGKKRALDETELALGEVLRLALLVQGADHAQLLVGSAGRVAVDGERALGASGVVGDERWVAAADDDQLGVDCRQKLRRQIASERADVLLAELEISMAISLQYTFTLGCGERCRYPEALTPQRKWRMKTMSCFSPAGWLV
jgi:hypothetical protein